MIPLSGINLPLDLACRLRALTAALPQQPVDEVLKSLSSLPADKQGPVRNNAGGHANHSLLWESMSPQGGGAPEGALATAIDAAFGSFDAFKTRFQDAGVARFGSGWVCLVHDGSGLAITSTANQDSPVSDGQAPLLGNDVWEHAYYLNYKNKRPDYLAAALRRDAAAGADLLDLGVDEQIRTAALKRTLAERPDLLIQTPPTTSSMVILSRPAIAGLLSRRILRSPTKNERRGGRNHDPSDPVPHHATGRDQRAAAPAGRAGHSSSRS